MHRLLVATVAVAAFVAAAAVWLSWCSPSSREEHDRRSALTASAPTMEPPAVERPAVRVIGSAERPAPSATTEPLDESSLMARLRQMKESDAVQAIALARDGNRRFPDSAAASERASILIHALAHEGRSSEARGEAEDAVNRYPDSAWVREIEQFTGAHRHRNIRRNDAGQLEYF